MSNTTPSITAAGETDDRRREVREHLHQVRAFQVHAWVFAAGMALIFIVNWATNAAAGIGGHWSAWWSGWALIGWGLGVGVHGLAVRIARPDSAWEGQQINELLA